MSVENPYDWAEQAAEDINERESSLRAKKAAQEAEKVLQKEIADQREADFSKSAQEFVPAILGKVQLAVSAFNGRASAGQEVEAPFMIGPATGIGIRKRWQSVDPIKPLLGLSDKPVQTTAVLTLKERTLAVFHTHSVGRDDSSTRLEMGRSLERDRYSIDLDTDGQMVLTEQGRVVPQDEFIQRFCMPLFKYTGSTNDK